MALLIRWANDNFVSELPVITAILVVMGVMALITHAIGVHTVLGAFVAGILVGQSPILTQHIDEQLRGLIVAPVHAGVFRHRRAAGRSRRARRPDRYSRCRCC